MRPAIFSNVDNFKQAFAQGLQEILQQADLGCFILVCANAFADPELHRDMLPAIESQFISLQQAFKAGALESGAVTATEEDQVIFVTMMLSIPVTVHPINPLVNRSQRESNFTGKGIEGLRNIWLIFRLIPIRMLR